MTEISVLKAIILAKPRLLGRVLDDFYGRFLFTYNVAFSFIAHFGNCHIRGSIGGVCGVGGSLLAGHLKPTTVSSPLFWKIFVSVTMGLCLFSFVVIFIRKIVEHYKEKNLVENVQVNLGPNQHLFNTSKYNKSVFNIKILVVFLIVICSVGVLLSLKYFTANMDHEEILLKYTTFIFLWWVCGPFLFSILIPIVFLFSNTDFRNFMFNEIKDFFNIQSPPHFVHE